MYQIRFLPVVATAFVIGLTGCSDGPKLGTVNGTVKVNGKALPYAYVVFQPIDPQGAYGSAYTNEEGEYELQFSRHRKGAPLGQHRVSIRAARAEELPESSAAAPKVTLPAIYNTETELVRKVVAGHNKHDFELQATTVASRQR